MNKFFRRLLYISFFLLFFIASAITIFYSLGYRYDFDNRLIEKNGAFFIKSYPRNAVISIDGKQTRSRTPDQIINIKPGKHLVEVSRDGYEPWQKNLEITSGQTTFAEEIGLFLTERTKTDLGPGSETFIINKNKDRYAYLLDNELWLVNTQSAKQFLIFEFAQTVELIDWSPDSQTLLIKINNQYQTFDLSQKTLETLNLPKFDKIVWDNDDNNLLWYLAQGTVYRYNLTLKTNVDKFSLVDDFALSGKYIITQTITDSNSQIIQYHKESNEKIVEESGLNLGKLALFLADNDKLIFSLGTKLYIKRHLEDVISFPASLIRIYNRYLLISDGHEIWLYDYANDWKDIIERSSQIVADIVWHPNASYFIDEIDGVTTLYELDGRDQRNHIELLNNPLKKMYLFNRRGDKLFVLTPEENFYLEIQ